jgi:multicomponent Na+:H+ antiporter subunit D
MFVPAAVLTVLALAIGFIPQIRHAAEFVGGEMTDRAGYQARVLDGAKGLPVTIPHSKEPLAPAIYRGVGAAVLGLLLAGASVFGRHEEDGSLARAFRAVTQQLRAAHSGHIGDYVAFLTFGVAAFGGVLAILLKVL